MKTANFPIIEFRETLKNNPYWSSWTCFCEVVRERKSLSRRTVKKYFDKLIDKDDYAQNEKPQLLTFLYSLTLDSLTEKI